MIQEIDLILEQKEKNAKNREQKALQKLLAQELIKESINDSDLAYYSRKLQELKQK